MRLYSNFNGNWVLEEEIFEERCYVGLDVYAAKVP